MNAPSLPDITNIHEALGKCRKQLHLTPVFTSASIDALTNSRLFFKGENFQRSGAFKFRGACNAIRMLQNKNKFNTVITHSSGNHAGALALAARMAGKKCLVVMPENSPEIKIAAVRGYGARITFCEPTLEARERTTEEILKKHPAVFIHPYNNPHIIAGQGTAMLELSTQMPQPDCIVAPVGGGGLLSGTSIVAKSVFRNVKVYGAEPRGADDAYRSFHAGYIIPSRNPDTIADGLLTSLGELTFKAITENTDDILRVSEKGIIEAMKLIWYRMKLVAEPSGCVALAAVLEHPGLFRNCTVAIIISGGNIDMEAFQRSLNRLQLMG